MKTSSHFAAVATLMAASILFGLAAVVRACPFCSAVSLTFAQEIAQSQAAVIARLVESPPAGALSLTCTGAGSGGTVRSSDGSSKAVATNVPPSRG